MRSTETSFLMLNEYQKGNQNEKRANALDGTGQEEEKEEKEDEEERPMESETINFTGLDRPESEGKTWVSADTLQAKVARKTCQLRCKHTKRKNVWMDRKNTADDEDGIRK